MFLLPTLIDCRTFIAPQCSGAWFWCAIRCGHFVVLSMTGASKPRQESAAAVCEQIFARRVELLHRSRSSQPSGKLQARTWQKLRIPSAAKRHVAHRASPRHCHARARCSAPCTRAHACRARSSRTHHACAAPCVRASPAMHMLTHACMHAPAMHMLTKAHWPLADRRPLAHLARTRSANTLATSAAREAHASSTCCACH